METKNHQSDHLKPSTIFALVGGLALLILFTVLFSASAGAKLALKEQSADAFARPARPTLNRLPVVKPIDQNCIVSLRGKAVTQADQPGGVSVRTGVSNASVKGTIEYRATSGGSSKYSTTFGTSTSSTGEYFATLTLRAPCTSVTEITGVSITALAQIKDAVYSGGLKNQIIKNNNQPIQRSYYITDLVMGTAVVAPQ